MVKTKYLLWILPLLLLGHSTGSAEVKMKAQKMQKAPATIPEVVPARKPLRVRKPKVRTAEPRHVRLRPAG
jgi:hypothetical protein